MKDRVPPAMQQAAFFITTMLTSDFDYYLPAELIAQQPTAERSDSRMLVLERKSGNWQHKLFKAFPDYLQPGDLLVRNDTAVLPTRLKGNWSDTGGKVELLLLEQIESENGSEYNQLWQSLCGSRRRARCGQRIVMAGGAIEAVVERENCGDGTIAIRLSTSAPLLQLLLEHGAPPLPPYIKRLEADETVRAFDMERYQTIYAATPGAAAAPTAGLHFTEKIFKELHCKGVEVASVTLHVGLGTFRPVECEVITDHKMHAEWFTVPEETAAAIRLCRLRGGRIVAIGSTTVRALETMAAWHNGAAVSCCGRSELFIHEPYDFHFTDMMLTNFHLPRSTLLMMVSALAGGELVKAAYQEAVEHRYRFYSYGDCMLMV